jgi:SAM-dependent methyltransferase
MTQSCPACGARMMQKTGCAGRLASCRSCRSAWRWPAPSDEQLARAYDNFYFQNPNSEATPSAVATQLAKHLVPPGSGSLVVLDYGCGSGMVAKAFVERGLEVIGLEPNEAFAQTAKARGIDLVHSLSEVRSATVDLVLLVEVIEHVRDPSGTLLDIRRVLKNSGRLYLSTPNRRGLLARIAGCRWREFRNPTHLTLFSEQGLRQLLSQAGFSTVAAGPDLRFAGHGWPRSALQRLLWATHLAGGIRLVAGR